MLQNLTQNIMSNFDLNINNIIYIIFIIQIIIRMIPQTEIWMIISFLTSLSNIMIGKIILINPQIPQINWIILIIGSIHIIHLNFSSINITTTNYIIAVFLPNQFNIAVIGIATGFIPIAIIFGIISSIIWYKYENIVPNIIYYKENWVQQIIKRIIFTIFCLLISLFFQSYIGKMSFSIWACYGISFSYLILFYIIIGIIKCFIPFFIILIIIIPLWFPHNIKEFIDIEKWKIKLEICWIISWDTSYRIIIMSIWIILYYFFDVGIITIIKWIISDETYKSFEILIIIPNINILKTITYEALYNYIKIIIHIIKIIIQYLNELSILKPIYCDGKNLGQNIPVTISEYIPYSDTPILRKGREILSNILAHTETTNVTAAEALHKYGAIDIIRGLPEITPITIESISPESRINTAIMNKQKMLLSIFNSEIPKNPISSVYILQCIEKPDHYVGSSVDSYRRFRDHYNRVVKSKNELLYNYINNNGGINNFVCIIPWSTTSFQIDYLKTHPNANSDYKLRSILISFTQYPLLTIEQAIHDYTLPSLNKTHTIQVSWFNWQPNAETPHIGFPVTVTDTVTEKVVAIYPSIKQLSNNTDITRSSIAWNINKNNPVISSYFNNPVILTSEKGIIKTISTSIQNYSIVKHVDLFTLKPGYLYVYDAKTYELLSIHETLQDYKNTYSGSIVKSYRNHINREWKIKVIIVATGLFVEILVCQHPWTRPIQTIRVTVLDTITNITTTYPSITDAAKALNVNYHAIQYACRVSSSDNLYRKRYIIKHRPHSVLDENWELIKWGEKPHPEKILLNYHINWD